MSRSVKSLRIVGTAIALCAAGSLLVPGRAMAEEGLSPFLPGITTGIPVGALPPPGLYFTDDGYEVSGELHDGNGNNVPLKMQNYTNAAIVTWVPNIQILGAQYSVGLIQGLQLRNVNANGIGFTTTHNAALFNTILNPVNLSWALGGGKFLATGLSVYLPDGYYAHDGSVTLPQSFANNFWTLEPNFAFSYLHDGYDLTLNNVLDFNTLNHATDYQSGDVYYLDATFTRRFGSWTLGAIGNYTQQFTNDTQFGAAVDGGNRAQQVLIGPLLSYNFGRATVTARYLQSVEAKNLVNASFFHLSISFKI